MPDTLPAYSTPISNRLSHNIITHTSMNAVHISTARTMLNSGDPVDLSVWRSDGSILELRNVISLRYSFYGGWRNVKILSSGECRRLRDCCIFRINGLDVFL